MTTRRVSAHLATLAAATVVAALGSTSCQREAPRSDHAMPSVVATYRSPYWYEEINRYFQVSADGRRAIYGTGVRGRIIDLTSGAIDSASWTTPRGGVQSAAFDPTGSVARLAPSDQPGTLAWTGSDGAPLPIEPTEQPRWSPNGARLASFRPGDSAITFRVPARRRIPTMGAVTGVSWGPQNAAVYVTVLHDDASTTLVRIDTSGATTTVRDRLDASPAFNTIAIAPDESTIYLALAGGSLPALATRHDPEAQHRDLDIYALRVSTGALARIGGEADDDFAPFLVGTSLFWTHNDPGAEVVVMPRSGGEPVAVAEHGFLPRWSPDGRQIAFTRGYFRISDYGLDMDGWVVAIDSAGRAAAPPKAWITGYGEDMGAVWSPDGTWVLYHSHRSPFATALYGSPGRTDDQWLRRTAGGPELRVTDFGFEVGPPTWSPNGRDILFDSWDHDGIPRMARPWITTIDPASGNTIRSRRLPLPKEVQGINTETWSPTGDAIAFVQRVDDSHQALWTIKPDGTGARRLAEFRAYTIVGVDWARDGTIFFAAVPDSAPDHDELFAIDAAGGAPRQMTHGAMSLLHPQASPDGRFLAATRLRWTKTLRRLELTGAGAQ